MTEEGPRRASRFASGIELGGKYALVERIGSGGVGEVWSAMNRTTRGALALKVVAAGSVSPDANARFRHEAALSASLTHRNIVRVYDLIEETDGTLALVMELLRGETARDRLLRTGLLPVSAAVSIATQVASALSHAHSLGIIHRDIKPPNIFLATEPDGEITPKLLDFGIAKTAACSVQTNHGQLLGTPRYMSPEQIRAEGIDGRSDLFGLGVVLYELLTGRSPFAAGFATASLAAVLEAPIPPDTRIPDALWNVITCVLAKDRNERYPSADDFAEALRNAIKRREGSLSRILVRSRPPPPIAFDAPLFTAPSSDAPVMTAPVMSGEEEAPIAHDDSGSIDRAPVHRRSRARTMVGGIVALAVVLFGVGAIRSAASHRSERVVMASPSVVFAPASQPPPPVTNLAAVTSPSPLPAATPIASAAPGPNDAHASPQTTPTTSPVAATFTKSGSTTRPRAPAPVGAQKPADVVRDPGF